MGKQATVSVRIDATLKKQAEKILKEVGMSTSRVITTMYKQIVLCKGIPFRIGLPYKAPVFEDQLTKEQLWKEIKKGFKGKTISADDAFKQIEKEFNL